MNIINKLERKIGKYAIPNLAKWIIGGYIIGYVLYYLFPQALMYIMLEPAYILQGQVWRLITWVVFPPSTTHIFFVIIMLLFYYSISSTLEQTWGSFRFNFYIFSGMLFMIIGAFILYAVNGGNVVGIGLFFSTHYINLAIFLAFAATYPDMRVMLYFIIPLKIKWLAVFDVAIILYDFIRVDYWGNRVAIIASLLNFIIFIICSRGYTRGTYAERVRSGKEKVFKSNTRSQTPSNLRPSHGITKHKCAICGRTEEDGIDLEFRFCTKCNGNYEYCQDHLFTHTHR